MVDTKNESPQDESKPHGLQVIPLDSSDWESKQTI